MALRGKVTSSAIILTGGRSSRMGQDKAALKFGGLSLLERTVIELGRAFDELVIVAAPGQSIPDEVSPRARILFDDVPYPGPMSALMRGLEEIRSGDAFACACDLPMIDASVATFLRAKMGAYDAVIPVVAGRLEPLHAVYRKSCARAIHAMIARGESRLGAIAEAVSTLRIEESELRTVDPELRSFINVNTPADYARILRLLG